MNALPLLIGGGILVYLFNQDKKKSTNTTNSNTTGFIYTCDNIKILDKEKAFNYIVNLTKKQIDIDYPNFKNIMEESKINGFKFDFKALFLKIFKKVNSTCANKLINGKTTGLERAIILNTFTELVYKTVKWYLIELKYNLTFKFNDDESNAAQLSLEKPEEFDNLELFWSEFFTPQAKLMGQWFEPITDEDIAKLKVMTN